MAAYKSMPDMDQAEKIQVVPALLSRDELKPYYGLPAGSIVLYINKYGMPQPVKVGNRTLWRKSDLDHWVANLPSAELGTNGVYSDEKSDEVL